MAFRDHYNLFDGSKMGKRDERAVPNQTRELTEWLALKDRALDVAAEGVTIADARLPDRPLIYANEGFVRMTGYSVAEVLGRNCRFLQGENADEPTREEIRAALDERRDCVVEIRNYRKDGTPFWNRLSISPVRDAAGEVTHFIGIQSDVTARREAEEALRRSKEAMQHDLLVAAAVQRSLLPPPELTVGPWRLAHAFQPCDDLAGDGVGVVPLPDGRTALYLLDVSGHGVGAALLSFALNHLLTSVGEGSLLIEGSNGVRSVAPPARVAERLNRQFPMERSRQYFTLVYGVLDQTARRLDYVIAGHPAPVLVPRDGAPTTVAGAGLPIGMIEDAKYTGESLDLAPGDRLYLYTDGVVEASNRDDEEFGGDRLLDELGRWRDRPLCAGLEAVTGAVRAWSGDRVADDVSLLALECAD